MLEARAPVGGRRGDGGRDDAFGLGMGRLQQQRRRRIHTASQNPLTRAHLVVRPVERSLALGSALALGIADTGGASLRLGVGETKLRPQPALLVQICVPTCV